MNLHPALQVVSQEVGSDGVQHVYLERSESDCFLVEVVPRAAQFPGLIPDFLHVRVVLDDDGVLDVTTTRSGSSVTGGVVIGRRRHAAAVEEDLEGRTQMSGSWFQVDAVGIAVEPFGEDHAVEGSVEFDVDTHVCLLALHL